MGVVVVVVLSFAYSLVLALSRQCEIFQQFAGIFSDSLKHTHTRLTALCPGLPG